MSTAPLQHVATLGIDVGKTTFHLIGLEVRGAIVLRQKLSRGQAFVDFVTAPIGDIFWRSESTEPWSRLIQPNLRLKLPPKRLMHPSRLR